MRLKYPQTFYGIASHVIINTIGRVASNTTRENNALSEKKEIKKMNSMKSRFGNAIGFSFSPHIFMLRKCILTCKLVITQLTHRTIRPATYFLLNDH